MDALEERRNVLEALPPASREPFPMFSQTSIPKSGLCKATGPSRGSLKANPPHAGSETSTVAAVYTLLPVPARKEPSHSASSVHKDHDW